MTPVKKRLLILLTIGALYYPLRTLALTCWLIHECWLLKTGIDPLYRNSKECIVLCVSLILGKRKYCDLPSINDLSFLCVGRRLSVAVAHGLHLRLQADWQEHGINCVRMLSRARRLK
jgi:membrane-associated phospholipid phosphatase